MGHESLIMQQSDIGAIADSVKDCLRCGKVQAGKLPPRATRQPVVQPAQQDPGHLAAGGGLLYEEQTAGACRSNTGKSLKTWPITAPCATKCESLRPVKIDFGDVSMNMRNLLRKMGQNRSGPATRRPCCS